MHGNQKKKNILCDRQDLPRNQFQLMALDRAMLHDSRHDVVTQLFPKKLRGPDVLAISGMHCMHEILAEGIIDWGTLPTQPVALAFVDVNNLRAANSVLVNHVKDLLSARGLAEKFMRTLYGRWFRRLSMENLNVRDVILPIPGRLEEARGEERRGEERRGEERRGEPGATAMQGATARPCRQWQ